MNFKQFCSTQASFKTEDELLLKKEVANFEWHTIYHVSGSKLTVSYSAALQMHDRYLVFTLRTLGTPHWRLV